VSCLLVGIGSEISLLSRWFYLGLGISAILNLVNPNTRQILKLTISLVLYGLLSGCIGLGLEGVFFPLDDIAREAKLDSPELYRTGKNHYEPVILASNEDMVRIKYLSVGPNAEHEQVKQLMFDHCHGAYIETSRVELRGYDTVEAECTHDAISSD